jgi:steroid 5-alpha reductase family enzyme
LGIAVLLLLVWAFAAIAMALAFVLAKRVGKIGVVDVAWAGAMGMSAVLVGALAPGTAVSRALAALLGAAWALRLGAYLWRRVAHEAEDGRYLALRERWRDSTPAFFAFFQAQALVVALFTLPFAVAASRPADPPPWQLLAAVAIWLIAVAGEAIADRQLARFRADAANRGRTCRTGLWGWSRHPNYFFEWLHWFVYVALAFDAPLGWLAWSGPVLMLLFLQRLSGIPWTEAQSLRSRGEDYRRYQAQVSAFLPLPPKRA